VLLCLTFSNEKKVETIFYTKTLNVPKAEGLCILRDATEKNALEAKKKKRKKSLSSRNTKTRRHIHDASVRVPFLSATN